VGNAMVQTATYAIISHVFSDAREKYLGYAEAVTSIGLMLGPVIGGPLYNIFGYFWSFAVFAGFLVVSLAVSIIITPSSLNRKIDQNPLLKSQTKITYSLFLTNSRAMFSMVSCCIVCFFMSYQSSFLTDVLRKDKHISENWNGLILALPLATCFIGCILVN
jgi:MFS family permease